MIAVEDITKTIDQLPPFPTLASQVLKILEDPGASVNDVIALVENDQSITANVLKMCNSAYYGLTRQVHSLREGLVFLGNTQLKEILLAGTVARYLEKGHEGYDLARGELWKHSMATGIIARIISKRVYEKEPSSLFTAALLHDLGKLVLSEHVGRYFEKIMALVDTGSHSFLEAETEVFGTNHAVVGGEIARAWDFPEDIIAAIVFHHKPEDAPEGDKVTPIVYLANVITLSAGIGVGANGLSLRGKHEIMAQFHLKPKDIQEIILEFYEEFNKIQDILRLY